jgi:coproporphyrinogen III oxidase-like Fe-S oxidoreductase
LSDQALRDKVRETLLEGLRPCVLLVDETYATFEGSPSKLVAQQLDALDAAGIGLYEVTDDAVIAEGVMER